MPDSPQIPLFPLKLLPLPDELVPLHIFEQRYRQLLDDIERHDVTFGIYCTHEMNVQRLGSLMKLESVIKRYPSGEADIVVRCIDVFSMEKMLRSHNNRMYPGGIIQRWHIDTSAMADAGLYAQFIEYQAKRKITSHFTVFNLYQIASELNLDLFDRYKFLTSSHARQVRFLNGQLAFQLHVLSQEEKSKDVFHLN